jgi:hypothetical protein
MAYNPADEADWDEEKFGKEHRGKAADLNHGSTCFRCNDAVISSMNKNMGRVANLKYGILESKMRRLPQTRRFGKKG